MFTSIGAGDDDRRLRGHRRLADRAAGAAAQARRQGREGPHPVRPQEERDRRVALLGRGAAAGAPPPVGGDARSAAALLLALRRCPSSGCTRSSRASPTCRTSLPIVRTYERVQHAFPGSQTPAEVVVRGDERDHEDVPASPTASSARRALATGRVLQALPRLRQPGQDGRAHRLRDRRQRRQRRLVRTRCRRCATQVIPPIAATLPPTRRSPSPARRRARTTSTS